MYRLIIMLSVCLFSYGTGMACTCIGESNVRGGLWVSDVVITGTVISHEMVTVREEGISEREWYRYMKYEVVVDTRYKGNLSKEIITVVTGLGRGDCGYVFEVGKRYIIYLELRTGYSSNEVELQTDICTRTTLYNEKEAKEIARNKSFVNKQLYDKRKT